MSDDLYAYRANDELAEAVREYVRKEYAARAEVIAWDDEHPATPLAWSDSFGRSRAVGFMDHAGDEVPQGLSRAKHRITLIPKKTKAGQEWQQTLDHFNAQRPLARDLFHRFGIEFEHKRYNSDLSALISYTGAEDFGDAGVFVRRPNVPLDTVPACLTPVPLSEFYAAKEAAESARAGETA